MYDLRGAFDKWPVRILLQYSTSNVGAWGQYLLLQERIELAWPRVSRLPEPMRRGVFAHELGHGYLLRTDRQKHWRDEYLVDEVATG
jgi:hypothetical protein